MSDDQQNAAEASGARRRPPPPTIDLTATELPGAHNGKDNPAAAAASEDAPGTGETPAGSRPPDGSAPDNPRRPGFFKSVARGIPWSAIGGGIGGALVVLLLASALRTLVVDHEKEVDERLARLDSQVREIGARPPPAAVAPKALDEIAARVGKLEQAPAAPRGGDPALANRLGALEAAGKTAADGLANLNRRADETAAALRETREQVEATTKLMPDLTRQASSQAADITRADLEPLAQRLAAIEAATAALKDAVSRTTEPERTTRLAILAFALDTAVTRGTPYAAELAALRAAGTDAKVLDPLQPFAQSGVPSTAALARELAALAGKLPGTTGATSPAQSGGFIDRLQANAERLVRVRPVNDAQGDEPAAIVARMQAKTSQGDVAGAIADAQKLRADARAVVDEWSKKAAARQAALAAAQKLSADSLAALGRGASQGGTK